MALIACPVCAGARKAKALERGEPLRLGGFLPGQLDELEERRRAGRMSLLRYLSHPPTDIPALGPAGGGGMRAWRSARCCSA